MNDTIDLPTQRTSRPEKPLLGMTVLLVEDSRFASEAMRLLCMRSGARVRRADCLTSARRHLAVYRPALVIVDLNLPDGSGTELITGLTSSGSDNRPRVLGTSGLENGAACGLGAGADGFIEKPIHHLATFQAAIIEALPPSDRPTGLRAVTDEVIHPDRMALYDDLAHAADLLTIGGDPDSLAFAAQFLQGLARAAQDPDLRSAADAVMTALSDNAPYLAAEARLAALVTARLGGRTLV